MKTMTDTTAAGSVPHAPTATATAPAAGRFTANGDAHAAWGMALACAMLEAEDAHENNFSSRRGTVPYPAERLLIYYDNNPAHDRGWRPRLLALMTARLREIGVERLAEAQYPADGQDAGYTVAMAFHPVDGRNKGQVGDAIRSSVAEMLAAGR